MILQFIILQIYFFRDNDRNERRLTQGSCKCRLRFQYLPYHIPDFLIYRVHLDNKFLHSPLPLAVF